MFTSLSLPSKQFPIANPPIPNAILSSGDILTKIQELVTLAEVLNLYNFSANGQGGSDRQSAAIAPSAVKPAAAAPSTQPAETSNLAPITAASENNLLEEATEAKE